MTDQNTFMEVLKEVAEIIRTSEVPMSEDEIMTYFSDMDLSSDQKRLVLDYLMNKSFEDDNEDVDNNSAEAEYDKDIESAGEDVADDASDYGADIREDKGHEYDVKEYSDEMTGADNGQTGTDEASKNSKVLRAYMEDLSLLETYEEKEIMELYRKLFSGETEVIESLTNIWLPKVLEVARRYMDLHAKLEDLIQEGNIALLMRLNQLCGTPDCSDAERSFGEIEEDLARVVEKGIMDYISEWDNEKQQENKLVGKISLLHEASKLLEEENGEPPTEIQLAEYTNMSVDEIRELNEFLKK